MPLTDWDDRDALGVYEEDDQACEDITVAMIEEQMRAEGWHLCPDSVWRKVPQSADGLHQGLCGDCEAAHEDDRAAHQHCGEAAE
jgi:hypothetical protein